MLGQIALHFTLQYVFQNNDLQWINELNWVLESMVSELSCSGLYIWPIPGQRMGFYQFTSHSFCLHFRQIQINKVHVSLYSRTCRGKLQGFRIAWVFRRLLGRYKCTSYQDYINTAT